MVAAVSLRSRLLYPNSKQKQREENGRVCPLLQGHSLKFHITTYETLNWLELTWSDTGFSNISASLPAFFPASLSPFLLSIHLPTHPTIHISPASHDSLGRPLAVVPNVKVRKLRPSGEPSEDLQAAPLAQEYR